MTRLKTLLLVLSTLLALTACANRLGPRPVSAQPSLSTPKSAESLNVDPRGIPRNPRNTTDELASLSSPRIVIKKAQRKLFLFAGDKLIRTYRVGLGLSPVGNKVREGDRRTPEGDFYIFTKNAKSQFYLSLGVSYPNAAHAERGLRDGLITRAAYNSII